MKFAVLVIIVLTFFFGFDVSLSEESEEFPRVDTPLGIIEGYYKTSLNGRKYEAYKGIPYAHPPIGESRFEVARSISPWIGTLMAKQFGPSCMQYKFIRHDPVNLIEGSEDCLYMNIYTAARDHTIHEMNGTTTDLLPVIFYIHGGAFQFGNGMKFGPYYLLDKNVTLVTINYRLGPLGFLSTEDEVVPGNMGLKDQVIAMRWVKDNIRSFGGDPSRITIFGQSAGGVSVHYHYLTNLTAGLFQGGMSMSGTALNCWAQAESSLEKAKKLATIVGCSTENVQLMVACLKSRPAHQIVVAVKEFVSWLDNPYTPFGPVVEKGGSDFTFIDQSPLEIITSGKAHDLPWITSVTSEEGLCPVAIFATSDKLLKGLNDNWETIAPNLLDFNYTVPKTDHEKVSRLIKQHYLGPRPIEKSTINQTIQMIGDRLFVADAKETAKLQAKANRSPVRFYYFSYRGVHSYSEVLSGTSQNFGVSHQDDLAYVLEMTSDSTTTPNDRDMQKELINLWVSFAADGIPNVGIEWPELSRSTDEFPYLHIAEPKEITVKENPDIFGENNFWRDLGFHENIYRLYNQRNVTRRAN